VNYSRFIQISPENALAKTNNKFIKRFRLMEELIQQDTKDIREMNLEQMNEYWEKAKFIINKHD